MIPQTGPIFVAEPRENYVHECNVYCHDDIHARVLYTDGELPEGTVAIVAGDLRDDIVEIRPAPELPPIDPTDSQQRSWSHRWLVLAREHKAG